MKHAAMLVCTLLAMLFGAAWGAAAQEDLTAARAWAEEVAFTAIKSFGTVRIPNGPRPVSRKITFPAVPPRPERRVVLRFQARVHSERPGGWNHYAQLNLNGKLLADYTQNGTPRVLNRKPQITVDEGRPYDMSYWGRTGNCDTSLLMFFGPGGKVLDKRIKSDRQELYWYVVDVTDVVSFYLTGADDVVLNDKPNELTLTNNLLFQFVKNEKRDLVLDDLAIGYIPVSVWKARTAAFLSEVVPLKSPVALAGRGYELTIGKSGAMHVLKDGQTFALESVFSSPGTKIRLNALSSEPGKNQHAQWEPSVRKTSAGEAAITAKCDAYAFRRAVLVGDRIRVRDTFTNTGREPVGILVQHSVTAPASFEETLIGGAPKTISHHSPENPSIFITTKKGVLGVLAEDNLLRLQLGVVVQPNRATFKASHFGLDAGQSYTFEWVLYPFARGADYYDFINRVRKDWDINYTIEGPFEWFHVQEKAHLLNDPQRLRNYLKRKKIGVVNLVPWLDYDNLNVVTGEMVTREQYRKMIVPAAKVFRSVDPRVKLIGSIESFPVPLSLEATNVIAERMGYKGQRVSYPTIPPKILEGLPGLDPRRMAACFRDPNGRFTLELWRRGSKQKGATYMSALVAYAAPGNAQQKWLLEEAKFLMDDCGLDGLYIDSFSLATEFKTQMRFNYAAWDGRTVDIDPDTGRVLRKYTDAAFVGAAAREELIQYVLGKKKGSVFVANSYACVRETQSLPTFRFSESEYGFNPLLIGKGQKPPLVPRFAAGHLSSPIGLGYRPARLRPHDRTKYSFIIMKSVITYLRHGGLYYYYGNDIPAEGPGSGEYGPINHMFPITPVELREGYIIGKERILSAVSRTFKWEHEKRPQVLVFDTTGRPVQPDADIRRAGKGWSVQLRLEDWENVAVIE